MKYKCVSKLDIIATRWEKHGDHERVNKVPEGVSINGITDTSQLGCIETSPGQNTIFGGPIWLIETGGNFFPVDDNYFNDFYLITGEVKENGD